MKWIKKYKLIKSYPGVIIPVGSIVEEDNKCISPDYKISHKNITYIHSPEIIENYPEFWEEIINKDYEILSFKFKNSTSENDLFRLQTDGTYMRDTNISSNLNEMLGLVKEKEKDNTYSFIIYQIKRLSDGEIFTIGDNVQYLNTKFIIDFFDSDLKDNIYINNREKCLTLSINYIKKTKIKLFTTEDQVDIFEGDNFFRVLYTLNSIQSLNSNNSHELFDKDSNYKYFSTKEKAKEYIIYNKPCFSINELGEIITLCISERVGLARIVKEKLGYKGSPIK